VRIRAYDDFTPNGEQLTARDMSACISPKDLCDLMLKVILTKELPPITILHGISDKRFKRLNLDESKKLVGYEPKSDAFALSNIKFHDVT
jgi:uronate dehydrogenase